MSSKLSDAELERYSRQLALPELGAAGQARLRRATTLVVGAGSLGASVAGYLAAAGSGRIGIVDPDSVGLSDLSGEFLRVTTDVGRNKAEAAAARLCALNPEVQIDTYPAELDGENSTAIITGHELVVDCSGNRSTRELVNDGCLALGTPLIEAGLDGLSGWLAVTSPGESACYGCIPAELRSEPDRSPRRGLGAAAGLIGSLAALEAIKLLTTGDAALDRVLRIDAFGAGIDEIPVSRRGDCAACGDPAPALGQAV